MAIFAERGLPESPARAYYCFSKIAKEWIRRKRNTSEE
jgi:hypothetical protein